MVGDFNADTTVVVVADLKFLRFATALRVATFLCPGR